jgi:phosphatidylserine decarboxylase
MKDIFYYDRVTQKQEKEKIYIQPFLSFLYKTNFFSRLLLSLIAKNDFFSKFYGWLQNKSFSKRRIKKFVQFHAINTLEFAPLDTFSSFNDFFIHKLNPGNRPFSSDPNVVISCADSRVLVFPNLWNAQGFYVKGEKFSLIDFLQDSYLAQNYMEGSMAIFRLAPQDYHRFHFPCDGIAKEASLINGYLYSVNPIALKKNIQIFCQNKRMITEIDSKNFGKILMIEIGATNVGTIHQTYSKNHEIKKGDEKGYFSLGGSSIVLLFEKNSIVFDQDLIKHSEENMETKLLWGMSIGKKKH